MSELQEFIHNYTTVRIEKILAEYREHHELEVGVADELADMYTARAFDLIDGDPYCRAVLATIRRCPGGMHASQIELQELLVKRMFVVLNGDPRAFEVFP